MTTTEIQPVEDQEMAQDLAQEAADRLDEGLERIWNEGAFGFSKAKPLERLHGYMIGTLGGLTWERYGIQTADLALLLSEDYMERRKAGMAPRLQVERWHQMRQLAEATQEIGGATQANLPPEPPMMWVYLMRMPDKFVGRRIQDLRELVRDAERKRE